MRPRALDGEQRVPIGDVPDVGARPLALLDPFVVGVRVRCVDDQEVAAALEAVDDQVVDDAALLVREQRVLGLTDLEPVDVVREHGLEQIACVGAFDLDLAHVRDVEDTAVSAHGAVLGDDALVLHGHLPAGEGHHPGAERDVALVERRAKQRLHAPRMLTAGDFAERGFAEARR